MRRRRQGGGKTVAGGRGVNVGVRVLPLELSGGSSGWGWRDLGVLRLRVGGSWWMDDVM